MKPYPHLLFFWVILPFFLAAQEKHVPAFEEILSLRSAGTPVISPDGQHVVYTVRTTDWKKNGYDTEIWLKKAGAQPFQLTNTQEGSSTNPQWSPDGQWISFVADRGEKSQIYAIRISGGEAVALTHEKEGVGSYAWSPDGKKIAFTRQQGESKSEKEREARFGAYAVDDEEYRLNWLYAIEVDPNQASPDELPCYDPKDETAQPWNCIEWKKAEALLDSVDFTIRGFSWSPDGSRIAITHTPDPLINSFFDADISILDLASGTLTSLVANPSADDFLDWSPDGQQILFSSDLDNRESNYYLNNQVFRMPVTGGDPVPLATDLDEDKSGFTWTPAGIIFTAYQKTNRYLFRADPENGTTSILEKGPGIILGFTTSDDGRRIAYQAESGKDLRELYLHDIREQQPEKLSDFTSQIRNWKVAQSEVISWKSQDGATIEGILHKPADYDPDKKYPLLVVIHGGPTGIDLPTPVYGGVFPVNQWLYKGALVLRVNYRGSAGYGEAFRSLNVRNLGVGDAWDVLSGVDYLDQQGMIDTDRMGCMGWSQGGYISAFLTTHTDRFRAISVGAGISNWMTYYVNTDIHPFTRQYLKATPWSDEAIYRKTSPMTTINQASTPTLIQHGEFDRRVPIANAYELIQGLRDHDVPGKLIVYKGFGHGISKPKERLAALWHNWQWFNHYLWGEDVKLPFED